MGDPTKFVFKADNGYSLTMYVEFDKHMVISEDEAEAINSAEKPAYLIGEALRHSRKDYSGKFKIHSQVRDPQNNELDMDDENYGTHPLKQLEDKYIETVKLLTGDSGQPSKSLGVDLRGTVMPGSLIFERDDVTPQQMKLFEGAYYGIPHWYRVENSTMGREVVEAKFETAVKKAGFAESFVQKEDFKADGWTNSL